MSILSEEDIKGKITRLCKFKYPNETTNIEELLNLTKQLIKRMENRN